MAVTSAWFEPYSWSVTPSLLALLLANAVPIFGVLFLGWTVFPLILLYWLENVVVGGFNVLKMLLAQPDQPIYWAGKAFLIPFFIVHFGMFTFVHGIFVFALFGPKDVEPFSYVRIVPGAIHANALGWSVLALVLSHGFSFAWNYLKNGEFRRASLSALMHQPYGRVMVLHFTVLLGGWLVMLLSSPVGALVVLVALKTAADWRGHIVERKKFAPRVITLGDAERVDKVGSRE